MPVLNVTSFWLFALATSAFSALNERELRQRRADLQSMVEIGAPARRRRATRSSSRGSSSAGLVERFGFKRGLVLGASDGKMLVLAAHGTEDVPTTATDPDWIVRRGLGPARGAPRQPARSGHRNPLLAAALPGARNLIVAPMIADGRPVGAIVVEHRSRWRCPASSGGSPRWSASSPRWRR